MQFPGLKRASLSRGDPYGPGELQESDNLLCFCGNLVPISSAYSLNATTSCGSVGFSALRVSKKGSLDSVVFWVEWMIPVP